MDAQDFLDYIKKTRAATTAKSYRNGIRHFCQWYKKEYSVKALNEILQERQDSQQSNNPLQRRKFEHLIEEWHRAQTDNGASVNSARCRYIGIVQFFKYFDLDLKVEAISNEVKKSVISGNDYPLTLEEVRAMYAVADLRGRTILLMAKDLGLRLSDFRSIKIEQLPNLDAEPPIPFNLETRKEHVWTKGFLSAETVQVLKVYVETLKKKTKSSPYLWPTNGTHALDEDSFGLWLKKLAEKAGIKNGNQHLTFHCFRRLLMRAAIETGVGLTAAKLMVGKAIQQSDETYIAKAQLKDAFIKLQKYLTVTGVETLSKPDLEKTVVNQQEQITNQNETIRDLNKRLDILCKEMVRMQVRHSHPDQELDDDACDKMIEEDKKFTQELRKLGFSVKIDELTQRGIKLKPLEKHPY